MCLLATWMFSLNECLFKSFAHSYNQVVWFFVVELEQFFIYSGISIPYQGYVYKSLVFKLSILLPLAETIFMHSHGEGDTGAETLCPREACSHHRLLIIGGTKQGLFHSDKFPNKRKEHVLEFCRKTCI